MAVDERGEESFGVNFLNFRPRGLSTAGVNEEEEEQMSERRKRVRTCHQVASGLAGRGYQLLGSTLLEGDWDACAVCPAASRICW